MPGFKGVRLLMALGALSMPASAMAQARPDSLAAAKAYVDNVYRCVTTDICFQDRTMRQYQPPRYTPLINSLEERAARKAGGVWLDASPLCDCQDHAANASFSSTIVATGPGTATATIRLVNGGPAQIFRLDLAIVGGRWAIANVHSPQVPDFLAALRRYLAS